MTLPSHPTVSPVWRSRLEGLLERTRDAPPADLPSAIRDELGVDVTARYGGIRVSHPFGKASGQLSCTRRQVEADVEDGIAFVVLKTVIAQASDGSRSMEEWASPETRMVVEERQAIDGRVGWTVTWSGRGWGGSFEDYLAFFADAMQLDNPHDIPIVPSVKYNLPDLGENALLDEYRFTTSRLLDVWGDVGCGGSMVLEKDFSPTLAGDERAASRDRVLEWVSQVPGWIREAGANRVRLGLKLMNAVFDDDFQVEMVRAAAASAPDYLVVFNRLFDRERKVAYGGWDLSTRNLAVLDRLRAARVPLPPLSATGNICSGRVMVEYALRGCENGQVHTYFQLPLSQYLARAGSRTGRALHTLLLHPDDGLVVWMQHLHEAGRLERADSAVRFLDLAEAGRDERKGA